jgi:glycosyltransferase involved in cell wall biosynthesis
MKIAFTHVDLPNESKGGVAHQVHYLANVLVARGHEVTMFSFSPAFPECRYRVEQCRRLFKVKAVPRLDSFLFAQAMTRINFSGFDVIHTNGDNYLLTTSLPQLRTFYGSAQDEAKNAVSFKRRIYQNVMAGLEKRSVSRATLNAGISEATRDRIPAIEYVVPCGVDLKDFSPGEKSAHPTLLFVGTIQGRKRGGWLFDIFQREIRTRYPEAEFWSVADAPLQGEGVVNFGRVSKEKLVELFQQAWVFCLPSTYEGFGVPYIEAMASGTPVVASPNAGAIEVLRNGEFGIVAQDDEIGKAIGDLLGDNKRRQEMRAQGLQHAQMYDWSRVAERYESLYEEAIRRNASRQPAPAPVRP